MMNLFATMLERVQQTADVLAGQNGLSECPDLARITVEPAGEPAHDPPRGDMTTNAALVLADGAGQPPRGFAAALVEALRADALVARAEIGGPGFVNLTLQPEAWTRMLRHLLTKPHDHNPLSVSAFDGFSKSKSKAETSAAWLAMAFHGPVAATYDAAALAEQSYANPLFNTRYGHARARAVLRHARESFPDVPETSEPRATLWRDAKLERLDDATEQALIRTVGLYPHVLETAAAQRQPHRLGAYLNTLASAFHTQLRHGMTTPYLRFISLDDRELTVARLALVEAVVIILAAGLSRLGIEAPDEIT